MQPYLVRPREQDMPDVQVVKMIALKHYTRYGMLGHTPRVRPWTLCVECLIWATPTHCHPEDNSDGRWFNNPNGSWLHHYTEIMRQASMLLRPCAETKRRARIWHQTWKNPGETIWI